MRAIDESFVDFVLDQLASLRAVESRRMFGGHGLYLGERFFGITWRARLFFRTDDRSRPEYEALGMKPFRPSTTQRLPLYYEVPAEIIEDSTRLCQWAQTAAQAERRARTLPRRRKPAR